MTKAAIPGVRNIVKEPAELLAVKETKQSGVRCTPKNALHNKVAMDLPVPNLKAYFG